MTKTLLITGIVIVLCAAPALAQESKAEASAMQHGGATGMDMEKMQAGMKRMMDQMVKMRETTDPQERQKLMRAHMEGMKEHMQIMCGASVSPEARLDMMHQMMEQMMRR